VRRTQGAGDSAAGWWARPDSSHKSLQTNYVITLLLGAVACALVRISAKSPRKRWARSHGLHLLSHWTGEPSTALAFGSALRTLKRGHERTSERLLFALSLMRCPPRADLFRGLPHRDDLKSIEGYEMYESRVKKARQYRGRLSSAEIAEGINVARRNAERLAKDARLLFENDRYPSALALAILAIEETGKSGVLRQIAVASDDKKLISQWRDYRTHTTKNAHWPLLDMYFKGARRLEDFLPMFDPNAQHPQMMDRVKQLSLYTDSFKKGFWAVPEHVVKKELAEGMLVVAEIFSRTRDVTTEEIDLWIQYLKPVWNLPDERDKALIEWDKEMRRRGLTSADDTSLETLMTTGFQPKATE
jgi:AbiV family abortive infection protein